MFYLPSNPSDHHYHPDTKVLDEVLYVPPPLLLFPSSSNNINVPLIIPIKLVGRKVYTWRNIWVPIKPIIEMRKPDISNNGNTTSRGNVNGSGNGNKLRKGLWSPEEDDKLMNYMITNGQGCWSDVARNAGLQRCGKSCRLRWINYLRPDLKRGAFSPQEEELIIHLHSILGNRC